MVRSVIAAKAGNQCGAMANRRLRGMATSPEGFAIDTPGVMTILSAVALAWLQKA